jgi:hypothetical protein
MIRARYLALFCRASRLHAGAWAPDVRGFSPA